MSGEYDDRRGGPAPGPDPDAVDPAEQEHVARLLAAAGREEPMPPDVATRLDAVLADLAGSAAAQAAPRTGPASGTTLPWDTTDTPDSPDTTDAPGGGTRDPDDPTRVAEPAPDPDELTARRGRRRWPQLLVAAASVSVLGLGLGTLLDADGRDEAASGEAAAGVATEDGGAAGAGAPDGGTGEAGPESAPTTALRQDSLSAQSDDLAAESTDEDASRALATVGVPRLRTASLDVDLQRAADLSRPADGGDVARLCVRPALGTGDEWLRVRLDGAPAVLVLRAPEGGRRTADVFTCDDGDTPAASGRIDAR